VDAGRPVAAAGDGAQGVTNLATRALGALVALGLTGAAALAAPWALSAQPADQWGSWRGPFGTGVAPAGDPPIEFSEQSNVAWRIDVPGEGSGSPVVWGERVFITTAIPDEGGAYEFQVWAVDRGTGELIWRRTATLEAPHEGRQPTNTYASFSPITDGERLFAYFGSRGLFAYDLDGNPLWQVDIGDMETRRGFGEGSSPALYGDRLVVTWDHEADSFIVALDAATGEELWRTSRREPTTWATPAIVEHDGVVQVITAGTERTRAYDLSDGSLIWEGPGLTLNAIPTPAVEDGIVVMTAGYRGNAIRAVRLSEASGDITGSEAILWERDEDTPYVPSPLVYEGNVYYIKSNSGVLTSVKLETGELNYGPVRLPGMATVYASPVGVSGRVYLFDRDGNSVVLNNGEAFEVLAQNRLDDGFDASPAIVGDEMYLRGHRTLYRISRD
jgi:outer membrane protein assembly factor BamB